jgi:predicted nucleotidyltransferase
MDDVLARLRRAAPTALAGEPVIAAYLFGSRARGTARPDSDVDVALLLAATVATEDYLDLQLRAARLLANESGVGNLDVVVLNDAPLPLRGRVIRDRQVVYSTDEAARVEYESLTAREFGDFQIHAEALDRELLRRHATGQR